MSALAILLAWLLAMVVVPWLILPKPKSARNQLDRIVINLLRWLAIVIVGTQVLAALGLYERTTIIILCVAAFWFTKLRPRGWRPSHLRDLGHVWSYHAMRLLDRQEWGSWVPWNGALPASADAPGVRASRPGRLGSILAYAQVELNTTPGAGIGGIPAGVWTFVSRRPRRWIGAFRDRRLLAAVGLCLPIVCVLGYAAYVRFQLPLANAAMSPGDNYTHMTWASELTNNQVMPDGIYPMGMASMLAWISELAPLSDMATVTRFVGPIDGTLICLALFYVTLRLSRSPGAALLAGGTFGLIGARPDWYEEWTRQIGALPQELCLIMSLLALTIVGLAVLSEDRDHLWTLLAAGVAMGMTHPLPIVFYAGLAPGLALVIGVVTGHIRTAVRVSVVAVGSALLGFVYIPVAMAFGKPFFGGVGGVNPFSSSGTVGVQNDSYSAPDVHFGILAQTSAALTLVGILGSLWLIRRAETRSRGAMMLGLSAVSTAILISYDPTFLGLSNFYADRAANIAGPQIALGFGAGLGAMAVLFKTVDLRAAAASLAAAVVALVAITHFLPNGPMNYAPIEYNDEATTASRIIDGNTDLTYTMVGVTEQRERGIGQSYFVEDWVFARDVNLSEAEDPAYELPIPTPTVYIFAEKKPFPQIKLAPLGASEEYYRNPVKRARIETITYQWAQTYMRFHTNMSVYYDSPDLEVFEIHQIPDAETALSSYQFKDYVWHPGVLFNSGPTNPMKVPIP